MRLHHRDDPAVRDAASRAQHRRDLDRVVTVIVEHRHAIMLAGTGEAALDAGEALEARADLVVAYAELARHGQG